MEFRIADTFTESLARLTNEEQKAVKTTAFDLQVNPANPGMNFHKLERAKDRNFWSVRVSNDIRLIVHRTDESLLLCYVDHHDRAYDWAERRKLETHPRTGAAQLVEIRETVKEVVVPVYIPVEQSSEKETSKLKQTLFDAISDDELLEFGVPQEWLDDVRQADEDTLLSLIEHLPAEAGEALLELATGGRPQAIQKDIGTTNPFEHPDALRRFRVMANVEELQRALDYPWDKWTVFLHPEQRKLVEGMYPGPVRVSGSAGTGKTIVALHRAVYLARSNPDARILLTTFSDTLANALRTSLKRLISNEPRLAERIDVYSIEAIGHRLYKVHGGTSSVVSQEVLVRLLKDAAATIQGHNYSFRFLLSEWEEVVDAWQLDSWEGYRDVVRLGRKTRLPEKQRALLWSIFDHVRQKFKSQGLVTISGLLTLLADMILKANKTVFDFIVVDEAQDISVSHVKFFAALGGFRPDALFFTGDLGQRIFQQPFSWKSLGIDIRGRSFTLHVNYRTSHQIRSIADRLLGPICTDVDGNTEDRGNSVSVFNGPLPLIQAYSTEYDEINGVGEWISRLSESGVLPHEFGIFVRSAGQLDRARKAVEKSGMNYKVLDDRVETASGYVSICTMHLAKGLEFRAVVVMACDDEIIPLQERIESVGDNADLQEVYDTERHLLYVACTRARDHLLVTSVEPASEFLDDMKA